MRRLSDERGMTIVELLIVCVVLVILMGAITDIIVSGNRASANTTAQINAQQDLRVGFDRLEFEGRCAQSATILSGGAAVRFVLPAQCAHASGTYTWCVASGVLRRYSASSCTGTSQVFASGITSPTPFALLTATGTLPRLQIGITIDDVRESDVITLRNAPPS
ncbi:MAG TPA: type II secretion system protein [Gaiellaceae bacterium]|jgi:type II secretory pathway pseudopilin PulG|nr:type II secretion system protein [Gaiellaceae bacterium]